MATETGIPRTHTSATDVREHRNRTEPLNWTRVCVQRQHPKQTIARGRHGFVRDVTRQTHQTLVQTQRGSGSFIDDARTRRANECRRPVDRVRSPKMRPIVFLSQSPPHCRLSQHIRNHRVHAPTRDRDKPKPHPYSTVQLTNQRADEPTQRRHFRGVRRGVLSAGILSFIAGALQSWGGGNKAFGQAESNYRITLK